MFDESKYFRARNPFNFINLPATERLEYEMLSWDNYMEILGMFGKDKNPFLIKEYKDLKELRGYVESHLTYSRLSQKRGGCDFLYKLKGTQTYIGLLNIFDLNREDYNDNNKRCFIGFGTAEKYREQGYTTEAVNGLIQYAAGHFAMEKVLAYTGKENRACKSFLLKNGFTASQEDYEDAEYDYYEYFITPEPESKNLTA